MRIKATSKMFSRAILCAGLLCCGTAALAASSFSNSLTGFTGDSTQAGTQGAVAAAGFNFWSTNGLDMENFDDDPTVNFSASGALFGAYLGDGGRNYMRTVDSNFATVNFVAEITYTESDTVGGPGVGEQIFFGLGAGDGALYLVPDWSTDFSSTFVTPENGAGDGNLTTFKSADDVSEWVNNEPVAEMALGGTHRLQMNYNATARTITYAIDIDYAGGPFTADYTAPTVELNDVSCAPLGCGGGNNRGLYEAHHYDAADYTVWRDSVDNTTDWIWANWDNTGNSQNIVDEADYAFWKAHYGQQSSPAWADDPSRIFFGGDDGAVFRDFSVTVSAGAGSVSGVPEPSTVLLIALGAVFQSIRRRRG